MLILIFQNQALLGKMIKGSLPFPQGGGIFREFWEKSRGVSLCSQLKAPAVDSESRLASFCVVCLLGTGGRWGAGIKISHTFEFCLFLSLLNKKYLPGSIPKVGKDEAMWFWQGWDQSHEDMSSSPQGQLIVHGPFY